MLTEGQFPCGAVESEATTQDVEAAVSEVMKTQRIIDEMQLFVCEVIVKNFQEEYIEEINECADKCHEPANHDEFAWDVNNCKPNPARVREARKAEMKHRHQSRNRKIKKGHIRNIMANDVMRTYFKAPSTSSVFVEVCEEAKGPEDEGEVRCKKPSDMLH